MSKKQKTKLLYPDFMTIRFNSIFINSNKNIEEVLNIHNNRSLLEELLIIDSSWTNATKITEAMFVKYKKELLLVLEKMEDMPKYESKHKDNKNYHKIILGGRGG